MFRKSSVQRQSLKTMDPSCIAHRVRRRCTRPLPCATDFWHLSMRAIGILRLTSRRISPAAGIRFQRPPAASWDCPPVAPTVLPRNACWRSMHANVPSGGKWSAARLHLRWRSRYRGGRYVAARTSRNMLDRAASLARNRSSRGLDREGGRVSRRGAGRPFPLVLDGLLAAVFVPVIKSGGARAIFPATLPP